MRALLNRLVIGLLVVGAAACGDDDGVENPDAGIDAPFDVGPSEPGVIVSPTTGLETTEGGGTADFQVVLRAAPNADVTIPITSTDESEGTVGADSLTFTPDNWNAPQTVTVTGVDDSDADGPTTYVVEIGPALSDDTEYAGIDGDDVTLTNIDDETAGITVDPTEGLTTTEMGGVATFTIVLNAVPSADVTIGLSTSDDTEGTISPDSVTFTPENFDAPQTITITGVDDAEADGDIDYTIVTAAATSDDSGYDGLDADDVSVTNTDDESAGILVTPTEGLMTTEGGGEATFTVVLLTAPSGDVTIPISSSNTGEGTVSASELTFTTENFNAPQTVTLTGVDDFVADGNQIYMAVTGPATSTDADYDALDADDVIVTNIDNETAGVTVNPLAGLVTTEGGGSDTFTVVLNSMPTADVSIPVVSSDPDEGTVSPGTLTFTSANWDAPQTVTVTGVNDPIADGDQPYQAQLLAATSADPGYDALDAADVDITNIDDETAGITVGAISGDTGEDGTEATFTVVLNSQPTADVTIAVSSSDPGEGTVAPATLTFTSLNWNALQTVTVSGVDDDIADGNQPYTVVLAAASSADGDYDGRDAADVAVINIDDDSPGITVTPTTGLGTTEGGGIDTFSVVLNSQPTADVTISITSSDTSEVITSTDELTFTAANWDAPQIVTVTGVDDPVADGDQLVRILTGAATSADGDYAGRDPANVEVTNTDNDSPGISVTPTMGVITTESGGTDTFEVVLNSQPSGDVVIGLSSSNTAEGTVNPTSLTFTMANWNSPQTVTVTGVDDLVADGSQTYRILTAAASSGDAQYNGIDAADVEVTNTDNDSPGITLVLADGISDEGGDTAALRLVLNSQPTDDVVIVPTSLDTTEGVVDVPNVTFTSSNWNAPQTFTISGQDDDVQDGNQNYQIRFTVTSADAGYDGRSIPRPTLNNVDDDTAGVIITVPDNTTEEAGEGDTGLVRIVLQSEPVSNVTVNLTSNDPGEGVPRNSSVTFTPANWDSSQDVIIDGVDDDLADGLQRYRINYTVDSADPNYDPLSGTTPIELENVDDDSPSVRITITDPTSGESGGNNATLSVQLNSEPFNDVVITFVTTDSTEGSVAGMPLRFTSGNWNSPQTVTINGVNDDVQDGLQRYAANWSAASSDMGYNGLSGSTGAGSLENIDDDSAGIEVEVVDAESSENLTNTARIRVRLTSEPTADVDVDFTSTDDTEADDPSSITFTSMNWSAWRNVDVQGLDDDLADGAQTYQIDYTLSSADPNYALVPGGRSDDLRNLDNDTAGVTVTVTDATTSESGGTGTVRFELTSEPFNPVTINISSNRPDEGDPQVSSIVFTPALWDTPQDVTIDGIDDFIADGPQSYVINYSVSSADGGYNSLPNGSSTSLTNQDDDTAGLSVQVLRDFSREEDGLRAVLDVALTSQPTSPVTLMLSTTDTSEGVVFGSTTIVIDPMNWAEVRRLRVTGIDDFIQDGDVDYQLIIAISSTDPDYAALADRAVDLRNLDNDAPGVLVTPVDLETGENGDLGTFNVRLTTIPSDDVTITFASSDSTEGVVTTSSVTFTSSSWNVEQVVTVTGVNDFLNDGDISYSISGSVSSTDTDYHAIAIDSVGMLNLDNDIPGIIVGLLLGDDQTDESGDSVVLRILLRSQPGFDVTIPIAVPDATEGRIVAVNGGAVTSSLVFTPSNWNSIQTVTVSGLPDSIPDGDIVYTFDAGPTTSGDTDYDGLSRSRDLVNIDVPAG